MKVWTILYELAVSKVVTFPTIITQFDTSNYVIVMEKVKRAEKKINIDK